MSMINRIMLCAVCLQLAACNTQLKNGQTVEVSGVVNVVGSVPITDVVITDGENNDWYIDGFESEALSATLRGMQHKTVTVRGIVTLTEIKLANNKSLGVRRSLNKAKLKP